MLRGAVLFAKDLRKLVEFYSALGGDIVDSFEGEFTTIKALDTELIILQAPEHISSRIEITDPPTIRATLLLSRSFWSLRLTKC